MQHIKDILLGLCVIALAMGLAMGLLLSQKFQIVLISFVVVVFLLFMSYLIGGAIRETREAQK